MITDTSPTGGGASVCPQRTLSAVELQREPPLLLAILHPPARAAYAVHRRAPFGRRRDWLRGCYSNLGLSTGLGNIHNEENNNNNNNNIIVLLFITSMIMIISYICVVDYIFYTCFPPPPPPVRLSVGGGDVS